MNRAFNALMTAAMVLWGIGLSLPRNEPIGIGGIGLGEVLLVVGLPLFLASARLRRSVVHMFEVHGAYLLASVAFVTVFAIGTLFGALRFGEPLRSTFIFLRAVFYLFVLVPVVAAWAMDGPSRRGHRSLVAGILVSSLVNVVVFAMGGSVSLALPGQNELGVQASVAVPLLAHMALFGARRSHRFGAFALLLAICGVAFLTWSKAAWIAVSAVLVVMPIAALWVSGRRARRQLLRGLTLATAAGALLLVVFWADIDRVFTTELSASGAAGSNEQRLLASLAAVQVASAYPFGVGGPHYQVATAVLRSDLLWAIPDPHNAYALVLSWAGVVGFVPFAVLFFSPLGAVLMRARRLGQDLPLCLGLLVTVYAHAFSSGVLVTQPTTWVVLALVLATLDREPQVASRDGRRPRPPEIRGSSTNDQSATGPLHSA